jgi:hypothetical protein
MILTSEAEGETGSWNAKNLCDARIHPMQWRQGKKSQCHIFSGVTYRLHFIVLTPGTLNVVARPFAL